MTCKQLDLRGLKCPLPVLKTRKALQALTPSDRLEVTCTDPLAAIDIPTMLQQTGDQLESIQRSDDKIIFSIVKGSATGGREAASD